MMKVTKNDIINDVKLLINDSCLELKDLELFKQFHKILIRMSFKASDVSIDYQHKRIYMRVLAEDESYDSVVINAFAETMSINLAYENLNDFLKSCILENLDSLKLYYPFLISQFYDRKSKVDPLKPLQAAF